MKIKMNTIDIIKNEMKFKRAIRILSIEKDWKTIKLIINERIKYNKWLTSDFRKWQMMLIWLKEARISKENKKLFLDYLKNK